MNTNEEDQGVSAAEFLAKTLAAEKEEGKVPILVVYAHISDLNICIYNYYSKVVYAIFMHNQITAY